ncbi:hypothetical protein VCHA50O413_50291 [Vibrio chagasii]|nr:hypothetical protein VCHA34P114_40294 [Vibrio chagasii]CAH7077187.1 hypothetical protein VCHA50O404_10289 [Vibrio chagasii]CAH7118088.1 hypothetical protein VCHA50O387_10571 [Vibrio chagasii]CAH7141872.1 hypothetical protein VCHA50O409_30290 [Vibrio chagasii]CAH7190118.1 hypothetical protein VCHA50O405_30292 [Vibrio chagasii]
MGRERLLLCVWAVNVRRVKFGFLIHNTNSYMFLLGKNEFKFVENS